MDLDVLDVLAELDEYEKFNKSASYLPYGHPDTLCPDGRLWKARKDNDGWEEWSNNPWQLEFHSAGKDHMQRMLIAANRVGKTFSAAFEVACHMTGDYPDWWQGHRFDQPVLVWTGSPTNETSRDIVQKELLGGSGEALGTGAVPKRYIVGKPKFRQAGVSDVIDTFQVRHKSGGLSKCILKTYEQGWRKWQGAAPHLIWLDEEPTDINIYTEGLTRLTTTKGRLLITYTPLLGQTELYRRFLENDHAVIVNATWDDAPHLDGEAKEEILGSYPAYQRDARSKGVPMLGEGMVWPVPEAEITCEPFEIPDHFARICGVDFGISDGHPGTGAWIAHDRDSDTLYVTDCYAKVGAVAALHSEAIKARGDWIPCAWPHDGVNREKSGGNTVAGSFRDHGVKMLGRSARYKNDVGGAQPQEPIILEILEYMETGRFKVFKNLSKWFEEFRAFHRKDGKVVNAREDILKATMYAVMMRRCASPAPRGRSATGPTPPPGITTRL